MFNEANQAIVQEADSNTSDIGAPPEGILLLPENCHEVWPAFLTKHSLRQKEGELVCNFIARCCDNIRLHPDDWRHFACPDSAQALFCIGGFRNSWLRNVVDRACFTPRNIHEIKTCIADLLPYLRVATEERNLRAAYRKKKWRTRRNINIYPWEYLQYTGGDTASRVSQAIWFSRPLERLEKQTYEVLKLN